jgi:dihydrolipoamide dehydrogenase
MLQSIQDLIGFGFIFLQCLCEDNVAYDYDLAIIGAGPGGYVAAIKAAQLGMKVVCIDKRATLGGTCLNVGCIPSKALLQSSEKFHEASHSLAEHGVQVGSVKLDLAALLGRKDKVVADLTKGIAFLFKKNGVTFVQGAASFVNTNTLAVEGKDNITAKNIMIATGSDAIALPFAPFDEKIVVSSTGALSLPKVPKTLAVIGGGYIGLELGCVWQRLGATVTVIEAFDRILPAMDQDISKDMHGILTKQGLIIKTKTAVKAIENTGKNAKITLDSGEALVVDVVLIAVGRRAYTDGLNLSAVGLNADDRGRVVVDGHFRTTVPSIYAIGDVIAGPMLAHKAEEEGVACVEMLAGQKPHINYNAIPGVVYTWPEAATVGYTEDELKAKGIPYTVGKFPFAANSRAKASGNAVGFVKLLAHKDNDRLLGAHILGPDAGTMIAELALALEFGASSEDIARTCHAHPTLNEAVKEAALACFAKAIHV